MMTKARCTLKDQSGVALVIALLMMVVLTLIGLASVFTSSFEMRLSGNKRGSTDAFYAADSGIQVVMANITNFNLSNYVDEKYDPFTNPANLNPTNARVNISHIADQHGSPRGCGFSATNFEFEHFLIASVGQDQVEMNPIRSSSTHEEKVVRLAPTLQGGY